MLLDDVFTAGLKKAHLILLEHDLTRSTIPILRDLIQKEIKSKNSGTKSRSTVILVTFLHPPTVFVTDHANINGVSILEKDYTSRGIELDGSIPKLDTKFLRKDLTGTMAAVSPNDSLSVIIDSVDQLAADTGSDSSALAILQDAAERIKARKCPSRLILSVTSASHLLVHLLPPSFSQSLTHLRLYHPSILLHLHKTFLLPPPPASSITKFYSVFTPFVQRERKETEYLLYGASNSSFSSMEDDSETVLEIVVRSVGLRKGVDRELAGWKQDSGLCNLGDLVTLRPCFVTHGPSANDVQKSSLDPTQNLPFNLGLTTEQQESRARVPLPYAHTVPDSYSGETELVPSSGQAARAPAIYYDPDSADDFDDEDPDEDLDL